MKTSDIPTVSKLRKYNSTRWRNINKYLKKYLKKEDSESLHHARVEIKKLTALLHLLEFGDKKFNGEEELKPLEKIFKLSGKLRDCRNVRKFMKEYKIKHTGIKSEEKKMPGIRKKLKSNLKKYNTRLNEIEKKAASILKKIEAPKYINPFLRQLKQEIITLATHNAATDNLHEIRKKIKELTFLDRYDTENLLTKTEMDVFLQLQDSIGDWHDIDKFYKKTVEHLKNKKHQPSLSGVQKEKQKLFAQKQGPFISIQRPND